MALYCKDCGTVGSPEKVTSGSIGLEIGMWLVALILCAIILPVGIVAVVFSGGYSFWRLFFDRGHEVCSKCKSKNLIPDDSPLARATLASVPPAPEDPAKPSAPETPAAVGYLEGFHPR